MRWSWFRIAAAITALSGIVAGFIVNIDRASREMQDLELVLVNYFSLFTIVSSLLSVVALVAAASWAQRHPGTSREPLGIALGLAAVAGPVLLLGIVYNILLRDAPSGIALEPGSIVAWSNEILHLIGPLFLLLDLFLGPFRRALPWRTVLGIVVFPLLWVAYTLLRAPFIINPGTGDPYWYPYPFLNPNNPGGWGSVVVYVIVIAAAIIAVALLVVWVGRRRGTPL